jgi:DNA-binding IclR family transcriptional regulator
MLLRAMVADPGGSQADWATATDVAKSTVYRRLKRLQEHGLVHGADGRWTVTQTGRLVI